MSQNPGANPFRSTEEAEEARERRDRLLADQERQDLVWLMGQRRGRRFLGGILEQCGVPTGDPFDPNALNMARRLGLQETGKRLFVLMHTFCPELYLKLLSEQRTDDDRDGPAPSEQS